MLVLTRKQHEKIRIGENITVTVLRMKGKGVRLGIQAPDDMSVLRGELVFEREEQTSNRYAQQNNQDSQVKSKSKLSSAGEIPSRSSKKSAHWANECPTKVNGGSKPIHAENGPLAWSI